MLSQINENTDHLRFTNNAFMNTMRSYWRPSTAFSIPEEWMVRLTSIFNIQNPDGKPVAQPIDAPLATA